mmetsp:Transcript_51058/g.84798  ORF Transcript_51058/g.84798 Transcript_51058/m.84798 type:complete len:83 (-) Transcript_51058:317-565(-)
MKVLLLARSHIVVSAFHPFWNLVLPGLSVLFPVDPYFSLHLMTTLLELALPISLGWDAQVKELPMLMCGLVSIHPTPFVKGS